MARQHQGRGDREERHHRDAHHEPDEHRDDQRNDHHGEDQQIDLDPGRTEQPERQGSLDQSLPGVAHVRGEDRVRQRVGQADRLPHDRQGDGPGGEPQQESRRDVPQGVPGLNRLVAHDGDSAGRHEQDIDAEGDPEGRLPQPLDVPVLRHVRSREERVREELADRLHHLLDQVAQERGDRVRDHGAEVEETARVVVDLAVTRVAVGLAGPGHQAVARLRWFVALRGGT
ncbi:hypothetical protein [Streptomyces sp. MJP52]|uniref:hypothetical protein n=1 Tax=Streptomyces sp. MJP52 TaxID=2940555 RepID=UPI002475C963|nr:hypothetical protein [Streptomyces sp. MJP52]